MSAQVTYFLVLAANRKVADLDTKHQEMEKEKKEQNHGELLITILLSSKGVRVVPLEKARTINHVVGRSSSKCVKLTKCLQQTSNPKIAESFGSKPKLGCQVYHNNIVFTSALHTLGRC